MKQKWQKTCKTSMKQVENETLKQSVEKHHSVLQKRVCFSYTSHIILS